MENGQLGLTSIIVKSHHSNRSIGIIGVAYFHDNIEHSFSNIFISKCAPYFSSKQGALYVFAK